MKTMPIPASVYTDYRRGHELIGIADHKRGLVFWRNSRSVKVKSLYTNADVDSFTISCKGVGARPFRKAVAYYLKFSTPGRPLIEVLD